MKKYSQEQVREAIMRLSMCARKECTACKYRDGSKEDLPTEECKKRATRNMNIIADVCMRDAPAPLKPKRTFHKKNTLCWDCAKNGGLCSWSENFTPVEGWEAVPTKIQAYGHADGVIDSYKVISCPEFELMERLKK